MRAALALTLTSSLFALPALAGLAPAKSVAEATSRLQNARATLAEALKRVEGDSPTTAELDAAHEAVNALKDVLDAGAGQEPNDLDYAKASLAARKEVREKREYVDQRRAKAHIFNHRRTLDAALATLKDKAKAVEAKEPSAKDFEDARAAVAAVKQAAEPARQFAGQDQAFAAFLTELDASVGKQQKAIDERWALLEGAKHRAKVEEARVAFTQASAGLTAASTDAQFGDADKAGKLLAQRLEEGKVLEGPDKGYGAYAAKTRGELAAAKKKSDELWSQTGFTRLKAELEPTAKDLAAAVKIVRSRKPTEEQLGEARTTAIVARKLLEKFQPEAERSEKFGQYVEGVRASLVEVENTLQLKVLDVAVREFRQALVKLEKKAPTDDDFSVASSALLVLDKTLEPMNPKDPTLVQPVADARAWQREGRKTLEKRRLELDVAAQQAKVEAARKTAGDLIAGFSKPESGDDAVKQAEGAVADIGKVLDAGAELTKKDKTYAWYDSEVRKRMGDLTGKIATRKLQLTALAARTGLQQLLADVKAKLEAARAPGSTDADLEAAVKAVEGTATSIDSKVELETQAGSYAAAAEKGRVELMKRYETLELARQERDLRKRTVDALNPGLAAEAAAVASKDLRVQKREYEKALGLFKSCRDEGVKILDANAASGRLPVLIAGQAAILKDAVAQCVQRHDATAPLIKPLTGLIAFDDGPKKAYEAAVALLARGQSKEALAQFDECTATAITVSVRNPELKERAFQVGGKQMTLSELSKTCTAKSKELLGKK